MFKRISLSTWIIIGLVLGAIVGQLLYDPNWTLSLDESAHKYAGWLSAFHFIGFTIFMSLLKMLVIPLILVSVVGAVTSVGDIRELGKLGSWTLFYYVVTMIIAVVTGITICIVLTPGMNTTIAETGSKVEAPLSSITESAAGGVGGAFISLIDRIIPDNIFHALANGEALPLIFFSLFFGVVVTMIGERGKSIKELIQSLYVVVMQMVEVVLIIAPVGVFCLLAWSVARIGLGVFGESIGYYMLAVLGGLAFHGLVVLPLILWIFGRVNPFTYLLQMRQALLTAFGTDSSAATLPVSIETATTVGGVRDRVAGLVFPLGATINMDGTALYEAVAVIFIAQVYGVELAMSQYILIAITATFAAIGAAAVPSAGLVTMVMVIETVNQSLVSSGSSATIPLAGIALIIGVDRILDMARTTVNVWGDAVGAKIISNRIKD